MLKRVFADVHTVLPSPPHNIISPSCTSVYACIDSLVFPSLIPSHNTGNSAVVRIIREFAARAPPPPRITPHGAYPYIHTYIHTCIHAFVNVFASVSSSVIFFCVFMLFVFCFACALLENVAHTQQSIGVEAIDIAHPWMTTAFAPYLPVDQVYFSTALLRFGLVFDSRLTWIFIGCRFLRSGIESLHSQPSSCCQFWRLLCLPFDHMP
jgi:hypothetical protein